MYVDGYVYVYEMCLLIIYQKPLLLTWINFNPCKDK